MSNKQHVQLPHSMIKKDGLEPKDLLIYAILKKYMNNETKECFPSLQTLSKESGYSINTIRDSIKLLKDEAYITIRKEGRKHIYKFSPYKKFEPFSYDFLDSDKLESNEKAYIMASQQFLFKENGLGKTTYSNEVLSDKLNISTRTISRLDNALIKKGYLNIVKTSGKDPITGLFINEKFFHLDELGQAIIGILQKHDDQINELNERTKRIENDTRDKLIILKENEYLKQENSILKNKPQTDTVKI